MTSSRNGLEDAERWAAVLGRDARRDGEFVFAVRSTGIYCRPSCPSRRPRRDRVLFFERPDAAERAGFRACLRCAPRLPRLRDGRAELARQAARALERASEPLPLRRLARLVGVSPFHLQRTFKAALGVSPRQYAEALRLKRLKSRLKEGSRVSDATYDAGFGSESRLYEHAPAQLGMTPGTYREGGRGMRIAYALADCSLGRLLVAATERGVSAVYLGDDDQALEDALRAEYPEAELRRYDAALGRYLDGVLGLVEGRPPRQDLPLDVQATAFQWRVWQELRRIPRGETRSYGEVAAAIGSPGAARAVARACASNRVGVVIPCHRVVGAGGRLAGYRWGVERKRALLEAEGAGASRHARKGQRG